jgi:ABC-2 type transport system permease protein
MNWTLFRRTLVAYRIRFLACAIGMLVWGALLPAIYASFGKTIGDFLKGNPTFSQLANFGGGDVFSLSGSIALGFIHPITLLLMGIFAVGFGTVAVAGERQRGTLEVVLARPISRRSISVTLFVAGALFLGVLLALELASSVVATYAAGVGSELRPENVPVLWLNGWLLFVSFLAIGLATSISFDRLAPALGITLTVVLVAYLLNVVASLWPDARWIANYSLFNYVEAKSTLEGTIHPLDMVLLLLVTAIAAAYAWIEFPRRDLAAPS